MATNFPKLKDADIKIQEALMAPKQVEPKHAHTKTYYSKNGKSLREDSGFFFCLFSRVAPAAFGGSQPRGQIGGVATQPTPESKQRGIQAMSATYTTAHGNSRSLTH